MDEVTPDMRRRAKVFNFGVLYGLTAFGDIGNEGLACGRVIESFLGFAQQRLFRMRLAITERFGLHLKECEFRFNQRDADLYQLLLKMFREDPLA